MSQEEITIWEKENQEVISGWEINYGFEGTDKRWVWYDGYSIIIFKMKDRTTKEFRRDNP